MIGNKIGTDVTGTAAVPNTGDGIDVYASNKSIGGSRHGSGNLISGNQGAGISLATRVTPPSNNLIQGN